MSALLPASSPWFAGLPVPRSLPACPTSASRALAISVPPSVASVASIWRCRFCTFWCVTGRSGATRSRVVPKRLKLTVSPRLSSPITPCSARRADAMLSPAIDPEQSTSNFSVAPLRAGADGVSKAASISRPAPSRAPISSCALTSRFGRDAWGVTMNTTSRSSRAPGASATVMPSLVGVRRTAWVGQSMPALASDPATTTLSDSGYSADSEACGVWCGSRPAWSGRP